MFLSSSLFEDVYLDSVGTVLLVVLLALIIFVAAAVNLVPKIAHRWETEYKTRDLTYGAVCLALSYALSWITMFKMPQGGSVTPAALAPLFIYCYYFGFRKGMIASTAYTLLQFTQGVYIVSPWSAFYDYILPCFALCLVGLFRYKPEKYYAFARKSKEKSAKGKIGGFMRAFVGHWGIFVGIVIHTVVRYLSSAFSGILFYSDAGVSLEANLAYTFSYNSVLLVDSAIALAATVLLMMSRSFNYFMSSAFSNKKALRAAKEAALETAGTDNAPIEPEKMPEPAADGIAPDTKSAPETDAETTPENNSPTDNQI